MIILVVLSLCYLSIISGKCEHRNKVIHCLNIADEPSYFAELSGQELGASSYKRHEELVIIGHPFTGVLGQYIFNFTRDKEVFQFQLLRKLVLKNGEITSLAYDVFQLFCSRLVELDLSLNRIHEVPLKALLHCGSSIKLETLNLSGNLIDTLHSLNGLFSIKVFDLSNNSLHMIGPQAFNGLHKLNAIHLNRNYLRRINEESFKPLRNKMLLNLRDNPLECDCFLRWIIHYYTPKTQRLDEILKGDDPVCNMPSRLRGDSLRVLRPMDLVCEPIVTKSGNIIINHHNLEDVIPIKVYQGDRLELTCVIFADPKPRVWWTFKDSVTIGKTLLDQLNGGRYSISNVNLDDTGLNISSTLIIDHIQISDGGQLRCVAAFHPGVPSGRNETSELFQLDVKPKHYHVKRSGLWILVVIMSVGLLLLICFVVLCWMRWSRESKKDWNLESSDHVIPQKQDFSEKCLSPILDLGPPMYGPGPHHYLNDQVSMMRLLSDSHQRLSRANNHDDFDIAAYDEDYRPLADDVRRTSDGNSREFVTTPLLFHPQHPSSTRSNATTVLSNTTIGETEL